MSKRVIQKAIAYLVETNEAFSLSTTFISKVKYKVFKNVPNTLTDMLRQS